MLSEITKLTNRGPFFDDDGRICIRCFRIGSFVVFAFVVQEFDDSFILVGKSELKQQGNDPVFCASASPFILSRTFKTSIEEIGFPQPTHLIYFLKGIQERFEELPEYFTEKRQAQIISLASVLEQELGKIEPKKQVIVQGKIILSSEMHSKLKH